MIKIDKSLKQFIIANHKGSSSRHLIMRFPNDYGASIITGAGAYGLEMARILFVDEVDMDYTICEEPFGWLEDDELNIMLHNIKETGYAKDGVE